MVSSFRMKIDLIGQIVLIMALLLQLFLLSSLPWSNALLIVLLIWQFLSACHLYFAYRYIKKINYLSVGTVVLSSLPIWFNILGWWAYLPVIGLILWYFWQTIRDTIIVLNRPKSFWDLF